MIPVTIFAGRNVAVLGLGVSGLAVARSLKAGGANPVLWDDEEGAREEAAKQNLTVSDLASADWSGLAALVLAPGIPLTHPAPHWSVARAREAGVELIGDIELFFRERALAATPGKVVVVTGTNGKSTTAALTAHLFESAGRRVALGGNIGKAVLDLEPFAGDLTYVIELSSFQIELAPAIAPDAAALLNITPDHLDRHGTIENYARIKASIFAHLPADGTAVVSIDDAPSRAIADGLKGPFAVKRVSVGHTVDTGVYALDGLMHEMEQGRELARVDLAGIGSLRGAHNWQNAAFAYALARSQGLNAAAILQGLQSFAGLAHRMQQVARRGKVLFVNDSKATNAEAAGKALASFADIYWIIGGRPKEGGLAGLEPFYGRIARAYLIGEAAEGFARQLGGNVDHLHCETLDRAVEAAAADAARSAASEPIVLLSPACASYDQFANFERRGEAFRAIVMALDGAEAVQPDQGKAA
ncbi:MAG TPA: UDP-N-acetylmuramoyl-L-alanine--D-glutamate ligase [Methyloceanibacter sp.]|nr:UDP-N-acetylmuramoyl-L-alanine--D-glutamate ligase [Methyloceanibacter sp.]